MPIRRRINTTQTTSNGQSSNNTSKPTHLKPQGKQSGHEPPVDSAQFQDPVRNPDYRLTEDEKNIWAASVAGVGTIAPVLLGPLTMLQPYKSQIVDVAAIDQDWRVALGNDFFKYEQREREAIVAHECLHVTCNHFARARAAGQTDPEMSNMAEDLEINQMVASLRRVKLPDGALYPNTRTAPAGMGIIDVPAGQQMEAYYTMIANGHGGLDNQRGQGSGDDSQGDNGSQGSPSQGNQSSSSQNGQSQPGSQQSQGVNGQLQQDSSRNGSQPGNSSQSSQSSDSSSQQWGQSSQFPQGRTQHGMGNPNDYGQQDSGNNGSQGNQSQGSLNGGQSQQGVDSTMPAPHRVHADNKIHGLCGGASIDRVSNEADEAGVRKARPESKVRATESMIKETQKRIRMNGAPGTSTMDEQFLVALDNVIHPPKVSWKQVLRTTASDLVSKQAYQKTEYSFKRVNRRGSAFMGDCAFPSMIGYAPIVMMAIDTSASRDDGEQFKIDMANASDILKATGKLSKKAFFAFCVDTDVKKIQPVNSIDELDFTGGGGTDMSVAFKYVSELPRRSRPDIFVLATDGGFNWDKCADVWPDNIKVIILITDPWYLQPGKIPDWVYDSAKIIDCTVDSKN